jgi:hypothetical protein
MYSACTLRLFDILHTRESCKIMKENRGTRYMETIGARSRYRAKHEIVVSLYMH